MSSWQGFYSDRQVSRLAHIPLRTLYRWKAKGFIRPSVRVIDAEGKAEEGYSYADLAIIKLLRALKVKRLDLRSIVITLGHLYDRFGLPNSESWEQAHVYIVGRKVFAQKPDDWDTTLASRHGQKAEMRVLGELFEEDGAVVVPKIFSQYVEINLDVMEGLPVIHDTRVPTYMLEMMSAQGNSIDMLAKLYSPIPADTIQKAIDFEQSLDKPVEKVPKVPKTRTIAR